MYRTVPAFTLMRAPGRFGLVVAFSASILAGFGVRWLLARARYATLIGTMLAVVAAAELAGVLRWKEVRPTSAAYQTLRTLPRGPVIERSFLRRVGKRVEPVA